ncbi:MAG: hypothetical protein Q4C47_07090 [Planctomycetia bacterium]|nr:hypothetical protein [Planctomycetia bacterium]
MREIGIGKSGTPGNTTLYYSAVYRVRRGTRVKSSRSGISVPYFACHAMVYFCFVQNSDRTALVSAG